MIGVLTKAALNLNGISIAYIMGVANAAFACLVAYGITLTDAEIGATMGLLNAVLILAVHIGHRVGEATASGSSTARSEQMFSPAQHQPDSPPVTG